MNSSITWQVSSCWCPIILQAVAGGTGGRQISEPPLKDGKRRLVSLHLVLLQVDCLSVHRGSWATRATS